MKINKFLYKNNTGSILLETLLSLNLLVIISLSLTVLLLSILHLYIKNLYQIELRTQMNFAAECMLQDIKHAESVIISQENGHDTIIIKTRAATGGTDSTPTYITYRQDNLKYYSRILKNNNPITGDNTFCSTAIRFTCKPISVFDNNRTYLIELKGRHQMTQKYFYLESAATILGQRIMYEVKNE
ncbi:hypothetical protein [Pectinatus frisingensis]|uniref:hypothetical protein n=1 Tax=Pectinatus frisingensis TaxID=865 RepID=UPI0018C481E0|nr:hypothetical protein [Pectinatus frisingensis]